MKKFVIFVIAIMAFFGVEILGNNTVVYAKESLPVSKQLQKEDKDNEDDDALYHCPIFGDEDYFKHNNTFNKLKPITNFEKCIENANGSFLSMKDCSAEENYQQDIVLNKKYKKLMSSLPENQKTALRNYQREWIKERDKVATCIYSPEMGLAFVSRMEATNFMLYFTVQRISEFDQCLSAKKINRNSKGCEYLYPLK